MLSPAEFTSTSIRPYAASAASKALATEASSLHRALHGRRLAAGGAYRGRAGFGGGGIRCDRSPPTLVAPGHRTPRHTPRRSPTRRHRHHHNTVPPCRRSPLFQGGRYRLITAATIAARSDDGEFICPTTNPYGSRRTHDGGCNDGGRDDRRGDRPRGWAMSTTRRTGAARLATASPKRWRRAQGFGGDMRALPRDRAGRDLSPALLDAPRPRPAGEPCAADRRVAVRRRPSTWGRRWGSASSSARSTR